MDNLLDRITLSPDICNGESTIRGLRITVKTVLEYLAAGETVENILDAYPVLEREDILAAMQYAVKMSDHEQYLQVPGETLQNRSAHPGRLRSGSPGSAATAGPDGNH